MLIDLFPDLSAVLDGIVFSTKLLVAYFLGGFTAGGVIFLYLLRSDERKVAPR